MPSHSQNSLTLRSYFQNTFFLPKILKALIFRLGIFCRMQIALTELGDGPQEDEASCMSVVCADLLPFDTSSVLVLLSSVLPNHKERKRAFFMHAIMRLTMNEYGMPQSFSLPKKKRPKERLQEMEKQQIVAFQCKWLKQVKS